MDSSKLAGAPPGRWKSTPCTGLILPCDFRGPDSFPTSPASYQSHCNQSTASRADSRARIFQLWVMPAVEDNPALRVPVAGCSSTSSAWRGCCSLAGWSLRTFRGCSLATLAKTLHAWSGPLPNSVIWDTRECCLLNISESPRNAVDYSWSRVLDNIPHPLLWLMPLQWQRYLARLARSKSHGSRIDQQWVLSRLKTAQAESVSAQRFSSLRRTDGIRWLSGSESLRYMGFPRDWLNPIYMLTMGPETPSSLRLRDGLGRS